jgi:hypothetical protein
MITSASTNRTSSSDQGEAAPPAWTGRRWRAGPWARQPGLRHRACAIGPAPAARAPSGPAWLRPYQLPGRMRGGAGLGGAAGRGLTASVRRTFVALRGGVLVPVPLVSPALRQLSCRRRGSSTPEPVRGSPIPGRRSLVGPNAGLGTCRSVLAASPQRRHPGQSTAIGRASGPGVAKPPAPLGRRESELWCAGAIHPPGHGPLRIVMKWKQGLSPARAPCGVRKQAGWQTAPRPRNRDPSRPPDEGAASAAP